MKNRKLVLTFLVIIPMLLGLVLSPANYSLNSVSNNENTGTSGLVDSTEIDTSTRNSFALSQDTQEGVLNPNTMTQRGYQVTNPLRARTDTGKNAQQNITIDEANDWTVSKTEIQVGNLRKLYAQNGTFDDEVDPWTSSTYDSSGGSQVQSAVWNSTEGYVTCVNYGELETHPVLDDTYTHHFDSEILWEQTITNSPQTENFSLSFNYRYVSGPLDPAPYDLAGDVELRIYIHNDIYYMSLCEIDARNVWYSISDFPIELTGAPASFDIGIGFYFEYGDLVLTEKGDYDGDSEWDGLINAQKIELHLDDIGFTSQTPMAFADVGLTFNVEGSSESITGPTGGIGTATIENPALWDVDPLEIEVTASSSVSFDYGVITYYQRDINSSWTTDLAEHGVTYSIDAGQSANLEMYSYIAPPAGYQNITLEIQYPSDWENATIKDSLNNDITGLCTISAGSIFIPNSLYDRVGWWKITHQAFNYAKTISVQIEDTGTWTDSSLFRTSNITRAQVELGTASVTPGIGSPISIDWIMPNGTVWASESASSIIAGYANSSVWTLGGTNTSAGLWEVQIFWNNGTELAYGFNTFELYHQASASVQYPTIETDHGLVLSNQITFIDTDTGEYLLDDSVSITANWSDTTVVFSPNFAKNWWQAEFDTDLIENGFFTVIVDISRPYFDPISSQFTVISNFETSLDILNAGSIPIENDLNEVFTVQLSYELWNGTGIAGAQPSVTSTAPQEGIEWDTFVDSGNGLYSLNIISNISTTYEITITLSKPYHYNSSDSFTLSINEVSTELVLTNGTADVVQYGDSYRLVVEYRNSTGYGLTGANLQIITVTPSSGLSYGSFTHITGGYYEITFTPSSTGTYAIVISANIFNHETKYTTFTLTGVVIPSILTSLPSSVLITVNETFIVQLRFEDESFNPIDSATITLINPQSGISISSATSVGSGFYNITIRSSEIGIYNLLFRSSAPNYQSAIVGFTVSVTALPTSLDILNAGVIVENGLNEVFTVQLSFDLLNGTGVSGALPSLIFSGPAEGLSWYNFIDSNNGLYSIDIVCNVSATYGITITMSKPYYYNTTDSFTLLVGETRTSISSLNGTADVVLFGGNYTVVLEYLNSTSYGLSGATLIVEAVTPSIGLNLTGFTPLGNGLYSITLTPDEAGTFSVVMSASLLNHETQYVTFTITATGIPTLLTTLPSSETIALDQTFTVQIRFQDESSSPISYENISVVNPPSGILISAVLSLADGYYNITLTPLGVGTYDLVFRGEADNYQSSSAVFTLIATDIPTQLVFEGDISTTTVEFEEPYELTVYYYRSDMPSPVNVDGADITVQAQDPGLVISVTEHIGYYTITIRGEATGFWSLTITANKTNHHLATKQFLFEAEEIDTSIEGSNPLESLLIGRSYEFTFSYIFESNSSYIYGADIIPSGGAADWITFVELGNSQYLVNLTPQELRGHSVRLSFEKTGFGSANFTLSFDVIRVPVSIEVLQGLVSAEGSVSTVIVRVTESDTRNAVEGVEVFCFIKNPLGARIASVALEETITTGEYSGQFVMPVAEGIYQIEITCEATDYVLTAPFTEDLHPSRDFVTILWLTTTQYYPIMIGLFALCVGLVYRRSARKKRIRENKATLAIKHRFDDIRSLMGVIVLHKDSGLPVYSKILREGLEETVISAFITAITSFRGEFDIESSSEEWGLIPISDIVRVISTNKLVCAFITTGNPSPAQRERMIQFAKTVGFIFDDTMDDVPIVVLDHHTTEQFNSLFEDLLDGQLLRTYKLDDVKKFPTTSCASERIARKKGEEFKLEELANEIASCGLEEGRVYKAIMDALDNHFLVRTEDSPFSTELLRAPDTVEEEG